MKNIAVVGHKNPDTDCTLSAIIMAEFLQERGYEATAYIQGNLNKETLYLLEKYNISQPEIQTVFSPEMDICLVDHNESSQAPDNLSKLTVTWIIDHHKIKFESATPLYIRIEPLCSTASILFKLYKENNYTINQKTATMMLACMMSDSLLWKSPTTTDEDKQIALELQTISGITDLVAFAMPMFEAKSDLGDMSVRDVIQYDYKVFEIRGMRFGSGTLETTDPGYALGRKAEILAGLEELKKEQHLELIMLSVVDILNEKNTTIVLDGNDSKILEEIFHNVVKDNLIDLGDRISRKKQVIPQLTQYFSK